MLVKRRESTGMRSAGVLVVTALCVVAAAATSVNAQAITCPAGQMPVPVMPADGSAPTGPVKMKCATPQEAMEMMAAAQQEMMKKLSGGTMPGSRPGTVGPTSAPAATATDAASAISSALGAASARGATANSSALPGPGHQPASDPVLATEHSIAAAIESGRLILRAVRFSPDGTKMTAPDDASIKRIAAAIAGTRDLYAIEAHVPVNGATWSTARTVSSREAHAFRNALVSAGAPVSRLAAVGYGAAIPEKEGDTNPRIEIVRVR